MNKIYLFFIIALIFGSCRKECKFKNLPRVECEKNFNLVAETKYFYKVWSFDGASYDPEYYRVENEEEYQTLFNKSNPFGYIDFSKESLLGIAIKVNPASDIVHQGYVCKNETENLFRFTAEYSLKDQCHGSGIYSWHASFWVIIPKLPGDATVEFQLNDINPFNP